MCEDSYLSVDSTGFLDAYCQQSFNELQLKKLDDQIYLPAKKKKLIKQLQVADSINSDTLNWVKMFKYCKTNDEFHRIVNNNGHIRIRNDTTTTTTTMYYKYTKEDFQKAMHALHDYLFDPSSTNINLYKVKRFVNEDEKHKAHMMCFLYYPSLQFAELRIIGKVKDQDPELVSNCRFVHAYFKNNDNNEYQGVLFLTRSHYGWYLVPTEILDEILSHYPFNINIKRSHFQN